MYKKADSLKMKKSTILAGVLFFTVIPAAIGFNYGKGANNVVEYQNQAALETSQGNYEKAVISYTKAIIINPSEASLYSNRGDMYKQLGYYQLAIFDYSQAIKINPIRKHYEQRARIWDDLKQQDKAGADKKAAEIANR
jgi:tetratricopeptide (TPR) repeat protein